MRADELFADLGDDVVATQLGTGPIPKTLLDRYVASGPVAVLVEGSDGSPLWYGRTRRRATHAQFVALAVRDRGCVLCRADLGRCQAHHLVPWTSPGRGRTDVDQMALLCERCHRDLHHRNHTLYKSRSPGGCTVWATRPATPEETPAARPGYRQRE